MLQKTNGIVLRSIKYGDSSIISTIFTSLYGVQTYIIQGVRSTKARQNKAGFFQPGILLELVTYHHPQKKMQHIREYQPAYIYSSLQESVVKNSVVLFSVELLLRLLPEHAPMVTLFDFVYEYFITLDNTTPDRVANFPLYFIVQCGGTLGYELKGSYSKETPYLNIEDGGFTGHPSLTTSYVNEEDTKMLNTLLFAKNMDDLKQVEMNADARMRLIDWYISFLKLHTQHMGNIKSLAVLRAILH